MLDAALAYQTQGYSIIPLTPGAKAPPLCKWEGFQVNPAGPEDIRVWWREHPTANIGIVTGSISGLTVVDVDGPAGFASIKGVTLPKTRIIKTPKGWHVYLAYHPGLHTGAAFLPGIDVRNDGGYVVAPPSVVDGHKYEVFRDYALAQYEVPLEALLARENGQKPTDPPQEQPGWVRAALEHGAPLHQRNDTATRLVGFFHSRGIPRDIIAQLMKPFAERCEPPMDSRELERTIGSVTRYRQRVQAARIQDAPEFRDQGDTLSYTWPVHGIAVTIGEPEQSKDGLHSELYIETIAPGEAAPLFGPARFNFTSITTRAQLVRYLGERVELDWQGIIETVARLTVAHVREGEPVLDLANYAKLERPRWLLEPFILDDQVTVLYGDGGMGKSIFALAMAASVEHNTKSILGVAPSEARRPLYLDWESSPEDHGLRYAEICKGAELTPHTMAYLRCELPITDMTAQLRRLIAEDGIGLIIVDSLVAACPDDAEASNTARRVFRVLRALHVPILAVSHVTKGKADSSIFGSVFWRNLARNTWLVVSEQERPGLLHMAMANRKVNIGPMHEPLGYAVQFDAGSIRFYPETPHLQAERGVGTVKDIILEYLQAEGEADVKTIAEALAIPFNTVRTTCQRNKGRLFQTTGRGVWGVLSSLQVQPK